MIGTFIGGLVVGGVVSKCVKGHKEKQKAEYERRKQEYYVKRALYKIVNESSQSGLVTKTSVQGGASLKLQKQVVFFDKFREIDNKLARNVREGFKGVTYLINGLEVTHSNDNLKNRLKNIRNYRGMLSHDRKKWRDIPEPSSSLMSDLHFAIRWIENHNSQAARLVYKGKNAFENRKRYK